MRRLTNSELRLAILFGAAVFVAANLFAARAFLDYRTGLIRETDALRTGLQQDRSRIDAADALASARDWIAANPPPSDTPDQASSALLQAVREAADASGLRLIEENLLPATDTGVSAVAALQTKLSGPFPAVARFLFDLQTPTSWRAIPRLIVRSDAEPPNVVVDMEIRQYYRPPTATAPNPGP